MGYARGGTRRLPMPDDAVTTREFTPIERQALDHVWIHTARWLDLAERDGLRVMVRGEGCRLFDAQGRSYLDGLAGLYVVNVGHGRAEIGEAIEQEILAQGPDTVAAVIGEPVSVSNSNHVPSPRYWQRVREICDTHGVLLVMDEVINGFGRTGTMFATEQFGVVPDLMTMAKGLSSGYAPIAAVAVGRALFDEFKKQDLALAHLLTFCGQAVSCAAALKNIEILQREGLPQRSAQHGKYLLGLLQELRSHPTVGDVRGLGLMCAVELVKDRATKEPFGFGPGAAGHPYIRRLLELMEERGLLTRVFMALQLCPPLVVSKEEIDQMVTTVDQSLSLAEREFGFA